MYKVWILGGLVIVFGLIGCNANKSVESPSSADVAESDSTAAVVHQPGQQDSGDDHADARKWLEKEKQALQDSIASLNERIAAIDGQQEKLKTFLAENPAPRFVDEMVRLVQKHPTAPAAFQASLAALGYARDNNKDILMNYLLDNCSSKLNHSKIVDSLLKEVPSQRIENWLRKIIATAPQGTGHRQALMGFKTYFDQLPVFRATLKHNPEIQQRIPAEQMAYINSDRASQLEEEIASCLERVVDKYADIEFTNQGMGGASTFGEAAKKELFELRNLAVGKMAPDISGDDLDGIPFRLSDYRGKVVMLDFWGHWCPPCRRMYPRERHLVRELAGLPFSLVGVNSDPKLETAKGSVRDDKLPWRNFWNGPRGTEGPIASAWNVSEWPTVYLIDADGIIRYKGLQGAELDAGIEKLMSELGFTVDLTQTKIAGN